MNLPRKPAYIYGRETAPNEKVYTEAALEEYGRAVQEAGPTVAEWWDRCRHNIYWSGSISETPWDKLWPEAKVELTALFDAARGAAIRNGVIREGEGE